MVSFLLLMTSYAVQKLLCLIRFHLVIFAFISIALGETVAMIYVRECFAYVLFQEFYDI